MALPESEVVFTSDPSDKGYLYFVVARKYRSVYGMHEESLPHERSECFRYSSSGLPAVGALRRHRYRGKSAFLEVP